MHLAEIAGGLMLAFGIYMWVCDFVQKKQCSEKTIGTIVGVEVRAESDYRQWRNFYAPIYSYEVNGKTYQSEGKEYSLTPSKFEIGSVREVKYNPSHPEECVCNKRTGKIYIGNLIGGVGVLLLLLSLR